MRGSDVLAWAGNNSAKLGLAGGPQCWTLFSTQEYGRANKVPQVGSSAGATSACRPPDASYVPAGVPPWLKHGVHACSRSLGCRLRQQPCAHPSRIPTPVCAAPLQENVPPEVAARVTAEMLAAFERSLGLVQGSLPPVVYSRTQVGPRPGWDLSKAGEADKARRC